MQHYKRQLLRWVLNNNPMQLKEVAKALTDIVLPFELINLVNDINNGKIDPYIKKGNLPVNYLATLTFKNYKTKSGWFRQLADILS